MIWCTLSNSSSSLNIILYVNIKWDLNSTNKQLTSLSRLCGAYAEMVAAVMPLLFFRYWTFLGGLFSYMSFIFLFSVRFRLVQNRCFHMQKWHCVEQNSLITIIDMIWHDLMHVCVGVCAFSSYLLIYSNLWPMDFCHSVPNKWILTISQDFLYANILL